MDRLNDTGRWVIQRAVPIFGPHVRRDRDGKELYTIGIEDLQKIADECNRRETELGIPVKLQIGHTMRVPETEQAPNVGYARFLRVGRFGPKKLPCLLADFYYSKTSFDDAKKYPFRSAEFYPETGEISAVALLERDAQLDLGALIFERGIEALYDPKDRRCYFYSRSWGDHMSQIQHYEAEGGHEKEIQGDAAGAPIDEGLSEEKFLHHMKHAFPHFHSMHEHYAASLSGTNSAMPAPVGRPGVEEGKSTPPGGATSIGEVPAGKVPGGDSVVLEPHESVHHQRQPEPPKPADQEAQRMQQVQENIQMAQYQRENEALRARVERLETNNATMQRESRMAKYERDLTALLGEGYHLELADEMKDVADLTPEQFARHCERIRKNYQKGPVGGPMLKTYSGHVESKPKDPDEIPAIYEGGMEDFENPAFEKRLDYVRQQSREKYAKMQSLANSDDGMAAWELSDQELKKNGQAKKLA